MPSKSKSQHNLMAMVANDKKAAKRLGIPQSVGNEFMKADKGKKFAKGGKPALGKLFKGKDTYGEELKEAKAIKSGKISPQQYAKGEKMEEAKKPKTFAKGGKVKKLAVGGRSDGSDLSLGRRGAAVPSPADRIRAAAQNAHANFLSRGPEAAKAKAAAEAEVMAKQKADAIAAAQQQRQASMQQQTANIAANQQAAQANRAAQAARFQNQQAAATLRQQNQYDPNSTAAQLQRSAAFAPKAAQPNGLAGIGPGQPQATQAIRMKKGGCVKKAKDGCTKMARGGGVESRGKTKGRFI